MAIRGNDGYLLRMHIIPGLVRDARLLMGAALALDFRLQSMSSCHERPFRVTSGLTPMDGGYQVMS